MPLNTTLARTITCGLLLALMGTSQAFAQSKKKPAPSPAAPSEAPAKDEKVDISDLEKKYWAPKDTDFSVVQNRTYAKEKATFVSLQGGPLVNDQYSEGYIYGGTLNYFFSERYGIQATYLTSNLERNNATKNLNDIGSGVQPNYGKITSYYGLGFNFVPFYAKMSFMGKKIMYFDMAITPTIGMTTYDQVLEGVSSPSKSALTYGIDISQFFFLTDNFAIRADLKNQWFQEEILSFRAQPSKGLARGDKIEDQTSQTTMFLLGFTLYFK